MRLLVLDRDGVINKDSPDFIKAPEEWHALPGSLEAIARLSRNGWTVAVASNQSGVGRGYFDAATLAAINEKMRSEVAAAGGRLGRIVCCPHRPEAGCPCRKPRPGLLNQLATIYGVAPVELVVVGDSQRDIDAAHSVGARPLLVRTGNGATTEASMADPAIRVFDNLAAAAEALLAEGVE